eukprot:TRINITY_DN23254_c0_g6_i3.p1 TRINITY_DN23254_c0_g6~~TRINITY_DN23254_c0_g6_i3.p1  ORF type:complete len:843 (-),score=181.85 TRINITY_DN23254_c0_g6_i3:108-2573(-)
MAGDGAWQQAFQALRDRHSFDELNELLARGGDVATVNSAIEWDGEFLTPLFVAALLGLDDYIPRLVAAGADLGAQCLHQGFLCTALHGAALLGNSESLCALLDAAVDPNIGAETSTLAGDAARPGLAEPLSECSALHVMVLADVFSEEVFRLLLSRGTRLARPCRSAAASGELVSGLELPGRLGNKAATEENLDRVLGEEVMHVLRTCPRAEELNALLELASKLKRDSGGKTAYRFARDVDCEIDDSSDTAMLYAAKVGNCAAARLLLYAGAEPLRRRRRALEIEYADTRLALQEVQALHLAALRGDRRMLEELTFFGISPHETCEGTVVASDPTERLTGLTSLHLAVLNKDHSAILPLLAVRCDPQAAARRCGNGMPDETVTPMHMAVIVGDLRCASTLMDAGVAIDDGAKTAALKTDHFREMFGGEAAVGLEDWLRAFLTGEAELQRLLEQRTDLSRPLAWPRNASELLVRHRLAGQELIERLSRALDEARTELRDVRPVHLACLLQQPWAVALLADAGAPVGAALPPCLEAPRRLAVGEASVGDSIQAAIQLDEGLLCVRVGGLSMLEYLSSEPRFAFDARRELGPLVPDLTPAFYPWSCDTGMAASEGDGGASAAAPTFAWCHLAPLELAILHRRVDVAVLLVRLGADLTHTTDHVSIGPPSHYSVTQNCFRGLTPLHLCALLANDGGLAATIALLGEAAHDRGEVVPGEHPRPPRRALLVATCVQAWATVDSKGGPEDEPWLWRDLTPLHLAIISKNYAVAEALVDASTPEVLAALCVSRDVTGDGAERSFSALLLAYERGLKDLHRRIARKFPTC